MNQQNFPTTWYADEKRNRSLTKWIVLNDSGSLEIGSDSLEFKGWKLKIRVANIKQVSIARQQVAWVSYLIMNIFLLIYFAIIAREDLGLLLVVIPVIILGDAFGVIVSNNTKWVRVEYIDEKNKTCFAFFADGSFFGWGGLFGGTEKLYEAIKLLRING